MSSGTAAVDDPNSCIPGPLRDFVFDLHQSTRNSFNAAEQTLLYHGTFRDLSTKYFASSAWPSPSSISSECQNEPLFLAFYREITHRHLHSSTRPAVQDRIDGWHIYRNLFDLLLNEAPDAETSGNGNVFIIPEWVFDIMHEFVYQFQGFCQFRTQQVLTAHARSATKSTSSTVIETLEVLSQNRDVWAVETVLFYLHRFISYASIDANDKPFLLTYKYLGIFSSVALSRLECLLGDYRESLSSLAPIYTTVSENTQVVNNVFQARLSLAYHAGVSYFMLRRYKDTTNILADICTQLQRGFKSGQLRKLAGYDQFVKLQERMIALLAIVTHICPDAKVDDSLVRAIREKHGNQLLKIEAGEEGYEDLFIFACPKFVSPSVPDYQAALDESAAGVTSGAVSTSSGQDAYNLQIKQFMTEMSQQRALRKLRSYLKLYTSIHVDKLAAFNDTPAQEFISYLLCYKHKMNQIENDDKKCTSPIEGKVASALDTHYFLMGDVIHISEDGEGVTNSAKGNSAQKLVKFEHFFMQQILANEEIRKEVENLNVNFC